MSFALGQVRTAAKLLCSMKTPKRALAYIMARSLLATRANGAHWARWSTSFCLGSKLSPLLVLLGRPSTSSPTQHHLYLRHPATQPSWPLTSHNSTLPCSVRRSSQPRTSPYRSFQIPDPKPVSSSVHLRQVGYDLGLCNQQTAVLLRLLSALPSSGLKTHPRQSAL